MQIEILQKYCEQSKIKWYKHALARMQERDISREDVKNCIMHGEIFYTDEVAEQLEKMVNQAKKLLLDVSIIDYSKVA